MTFDFYMEILKNETGIEKGHPEYGGIAESLIEAVMCRQFMELYGKDGLFAGFLTWEVRPNAENKKMIDLGITNLIIKKTASGTYTLMRATNYLRAKYPNVAQFCWKKRRTGELKTFRQRGIKYAEATATAV